MNNTNQVFRGILFAVLGCSLALLLANMVYSQKTMQEQEIEFAQESLEAYVKYVLNERNFANFGFKSLDEAQAARVGDPYQVMFVGLKDLKAYKSGTGAKPLLRDAKTLYFPVMVEGETRTKLEIVEKDGKWIAGEFGGIRTVQKATMAQDQLPMLLESKGIEEPHKPILVKIPALHAMFMYVESPQGEFLVPTMVQPQRFKLQDARIYSADDVLARLSEFAQEIDENKIR
jgi:hypothetical protein